MEGCIVNEPELAEARSDNKYTSSEKIERCLRLHVLYCISSFHGLNISNLMVFYVFYCGCCTYRRWKISSRAIMLEVYINTKGELN